MSGYGEVLDPEIARRAQIAEMVASSRRQPSRRDDLDDLLNTLREEDEAQLDEVLPEEVTGGGDPKDHRLTQACSLQIDVPEEPNISNIAAPVTTESDTELVDCDDDMYVVIYQFPDDALSGSWPDYKAMSVTELADALHELSFEMNGADLVPYDEIRLRVCAISVELNRRGKLAPRFRAVRRPPRKVVTLEELDLSRDRQFIDLHWLHCTGWNRMIHGERWQFRNVLKVKTFQPRKAELFAEIPASFDEKASWLALPDNVAFQLAAIQTDAVRERFRVANLGDTVKGKVRQVGHMQVTQMLETSVANSPQLQDQIPRWASIWMCARLVGDHAEVLRQFHALAEGLEKPIGARDIARRLETIRNRLGEAPISELLVA